LLFELLVVLLAEVSACGTVLLLDALLLLLGCSAVEFGFVELGFVALGFEGVAFWSVCGVVLGVLEVLGVVEGC